MNRIKISITVTFLLFISNAIAQQDLLTIQNAVTHAIEKNAIINQLRAVLQQKENEWRTLTGIEAPEISYFEEGMNGNETKPFEERRLTVSQKVDFPLTTMYRLKANEKEKESLSFKIKALENEVKQVVKQHYVEVLYALYFTKLSENQHQLAEELYKATYSRFETGMGNGMDLTKAELQHAEAQNQLDDAERMLHMARYSLFNSMGLPTDQQKYTIQFIDSLQTTDIDIKQIQALAQLEEQPMYLSALMEYQAEQNKVKEARSNILPDIRFNLYKQNYGDGFNYNGFEVGLSIPIWLPFEQKGRIEMAKAREVEIEWRQKEIELDMKMQIEHAWHSYKTSKSTIERYQQTIRKKAESLHELSLKAYRLGEIDLLNLISSQQIYLSSQKQYLTALRDYYMQLIALEKFLDQDLVY